MKCPKCGKNIPANSKFCQYCRASVTAPQNAVVPYRKKTSSVVCPKCGSDNLQLITEVRGRGVDTSAACCGGLTVGMCCCLPLAPLGALFGMKNAGETKTNILWVCKDCAAKFRK